MLTLFIITSFPVLIAYTISYFTKQNVGLLLPISIFIGILWIFWFGVADQIALGANLLFPVSVIIFVFTAWIKRDFLSVANLKKILSPSVIFFVVISIWTFKHSQHMRFKEWDEFAGWGPAVKSLFLFDKIGPYSPAQLIFPEYPPGLSLFAYYVVKIGKVWDEADVYWAYQLIVISIIVSILGHLKWKNTFANLFGLTISVLTSVFFYNSFQSIYGDPLLSLIFGYSLFLALNKEFAQNKWLILNFVIAITMLSITKDIGIFLAAISTLVLLLNLLISKVGMADNLRHKIFIPVIIAFLSFMPILVTKIGWNFAIKKGGIESTRDSFSLFFELILGKFNSLKQPYWSDVINSFINKTFNHSLTGMNGLPISAFKWMLIFDLLFLILIFSSNGKKEKIRFFVIGLSITAGFFAYLGILLFLYLTTFSQGEALGLASYERYVTAYFAALAFLIAALSLGKLENYELKQKESLLFTSWIVVLLLQSSPWNLLTYISSPNVASDQLRAQYDEERQMISNMNFSVDDQVWFIAQHTVGFEFYMFQYELMPANIGRSPWSIGSPYGPGDIWTDTNLNKDNWNERLNDFDYVFIHSVTDSFINEFGALFEDPSNLTKPGFYKVQHEKNGNLMIKVR